MFFLAEITKVKSQITNQIKELFEFCFLLFVISGLSR